MIAAGGGFSWGPISANNPRPRLAGAVVALAGGYICLPSRKSSSTRKAAQLLLLTLSTGMGLGIIELGIRSFLQKTQGFNSLQQIYNPNTKGNLPTRSSHPLLVITRLSDNNRIIYELKPGVEMQFGSRTLRISEQGLREDNVYPHSKPADTLRIVGIGDSGMWGWNVHQGEEYLSVIEARLPARNAQPVEIINFGVPGYNLFQEIETLRHKALAFQPDIVVVGWCVNDDQLPFFMYTRQNHWAQKRSYLYALLLSRGRFVKMISPEVLKLGDIEEEKVDPLLLSYKGDIGVRKGFQELKALSEEHGFKLLIFGPMKPQTVSICKELGMNAYNLYERIDAGDYPPEYHVHFMHPPKEGHAVLADHLEKHLRDLGWLP